MRRRRPSGTFASLVLLLLAQPGHGAIITVEATGTVNQYSDATGLLPWSSITVGSTTISLVFQYDDQTPQAFPAVDYGRYLVANTGVMTINGTGVTLTGQQAVSIGNDLVIGGSNVDMWQYTSFDRHQPDDSEVAHIFVMELMASDTSVLSDVALAPPEWPGAWSSRILAYDAMVWNTTINNWEVLSKVRADISNVVVTPVPAAVYLFATALGTLAWRRHGTASL